MQDPGLTSPRERDPWPPQAKDRWVVIQERAGLAGRGYIQEGQDGHREGQEGWTVTAGIPGLGPSSPLSLCMYVCVSGVLFLPLPPAIPGASGLCDEGWKSQEGTLSDT